MIELIRSDLISVFDILLFQPVPLKIKCSVPWPIEYKIQWIRTLIHLQFTDTLHKVYICRIKVHKNCRLTHRIIGKRKHLLMLSGKMVRWTRYWRRYCLKEARKGWTRYIIYIEYWRLFVVKIPIFANKWSISVCTDQVQIPSSCGGFNLKQPSLLHSKWLDFERLKFAIDLH